MMHLRIIQDGGAYIYIGQKPVADGSTATNRSEVLFDEDGLPSECVITSRYVEKLLGRKGRDGEWVQLHVS